MGLVREFGIRLLPFFSSLFFWSIYATAFRHVSATSPSNGEHESPRAIYSYRTKKSIYGVNAFQILLQQRKNRSIP